MTLTFTIEISMYNDDEPRYIVYENHGEIQRNGVLILDDGFEDGFEPKWEEGFFTLADALNEIKKRTDLYEQLYLESEK